MEQTCADSYAPAVSALDDDHGLEAPVRGLDNYFFWALGFGLVQ